MIWAIDIGALFPVQICMMQIKSIPNQVFYHFTVPYMNVMNIVRHAHDDPLEKIIA